MSTTGSKNYLGTRQDVAIEEEWVIPLPAIVSVADNVITFAANSLSNPGMTDNFLAGQEIWVLDDYAHSTVWKGVRLNVVANDSNTITLRENVEGSNIDSEFSGLGTDLGDVTDRLVVTQRGIRPGFVDITMYDYQGALGATGTGDFTRHTIDLMFGIIDQVGLPDPVNDLEEKYAHASASMPGRHVAIYNRTTYDATTWPLSTVWGRFLMQAMGYTLDEASAFDVATDAITVDVYPGEYVIEVADASDFAVDDYIELGNHNDVPLAGTDSEIRKIVNIPVSGVGPDYIVVDKPFRRPHAVGAGMVISEVDSNCYERAYASAEYIQHSMSAIDSISYYTIGVTKHGEHDDITVQDWKALYTGHVFPEMSFATTTNKELTCDIKSTGLYAELDQSNFTPASISRTYLTDSLGVALEPLHFSRAYMEINDLRWHQCEEMNCSVNRQITTKWTHSFHEKSSGVDGDGLKGGHEPHEHITGRTNFTQNFLMPLSSKRLWDLLRRRVRFGVKWYFEMDRSATFTEEWLFTMTRIPPTEGSTQLPNEPAEDQNMTGPPKDISITIKDKTPYY